MKTVFDKVIKNENQFSQLLVNLVNTYNDLRSSVREFFFPTATNEDIVIGLFDSQKRNKNGQPDIHFNIKNSEGKIIGNAIIEVKTQNSQLTRNQPSGYIETLLLDEGKHFLFFLIPKFYAHEEEIKIEFDKIDESKKSQIKFKIRTWNDLVIELKKNI